MIEALLDSLEAAPPSVYGTFIRVYTWVPHFWKGRERKQNWAEDKSGQWCSLSQDLMQPSGELWSWVAIQNCFPVQGKTWPFLFGIRLWVAMDWTSEDSMTLGKTALVEQFLGRAANWEIRSLSPKVGVQTGIVFHVPLQAWCENKVTS